MVLYTYAKAYNLNRSNKASAFPAWLYENFKSKARVILAFQGTANGCTLLLYNKGGFNMDIRTIYNQIELKKQQKKKPTDEMDWKPKKCEDYACIVPIYMILLKSKELS